MLDFTYVSLTCARLNYVFDLQTQTKESKHTESKVPLFELTTFKLIKLDYNAHGHLQNMLSQQLNTTIVD